MKIFYPNFYYDRKENIPYDKLSEKGIKGLIFDIDNTLTTHGSPATNKDIEFFSYLRELGFDTVLLSNNKKERVESFANIVKSKFIFKANKPSKKGYIFATKLMNLDKKEVVFIGDQIFTDIWGANRAGIISILVSPIDKKEEIQIILKRKLENLILYFYRRQKKGK